MDVQAYLLMIVGSRCKRGRSSLVTIYNIWRLRSITRAGNWLRFRSGLFCLKLRNAYYIIVAHQLAFVTDALMEFTRVTVWKPAMDG